MENGQMEEEERRGEEESKIVVCGLDGWTMENG